MTAITGGEIVVRGLAAHGVDTAFGIPGTHNLELYRHLAGYGITHVTPRHEQGAGYAADGYARTSGRPGIVLTTSGPAVLNVAAAVGQAYSDSVPMLVIAPGPATDHHAGSGTLHEMRDQRGALAAVAKAAHRVTSLAELADAVGRCFVELAGGRPGPVYLEVPLDLLGARAEIDLVTPVPARRPEPAADLIERAATLLGAAERPLLLLGGGARWAGAGALALAVALDAPILTTANGKGAVPEDHRLSLGAALHLPAAGELLADADCVLAVGTELAETDWWNGLPPIRTLIRVDVEATQLTVNARPEVALHGEAGRVLDELGPAVVARRQQPERVAHWRERLGAEAAKEGARWLPAMAALRSVLPRDAIVVADNAMASYYGALAHVPVFSPGGFCFPTGFSTLGYAVPAALGAAVAHPGRPVVAVAGDGGLMFSVQELAAAAAIGIALPVVVFANGGYGEIRAQMQAAGIAPIGVDLPEPDVVGLAAALGGHGQRCTADDLAGALTEAWQRNCPTVLMVQEL